MGVRGGSEREWHRMSDRIGYLHHDLPEGQHESLYRALQTEAFARLRFRDQECIDSRTRTRLRTRRDTPLCIDVLACFCPSWYYPKDRREG